MSCKYKKLSLNACILMILMYRISTLLRHYSHTQWRLVTLDCLIHSLCLLTVAVQTTNIEIAIVHDDEWCLSTGDQDKTRVINAYAEAFFDEELLSTPADSQPKQQRISLALPTPSNPTRSSATEHPKSGTHSSTTRNQEPRNFDSSTTTNTELRNPHPSTAKHPQSTTRSKTTGYPGPRIVHSSTTDNLGSSAHSSAVEYLILYDVFESTWELPFT
jgi:hypothetical protein